MRVILRERKQSKTGKISQYLEIYKGTTKTADGKTKPVREYKYLDLFLIENPKTPQEKQENKTNKQLALDVKSKTELEIKNGRFGFLDEYKLDTNFIDYFEELTNKKESSGNYGNWYSTLKHLKDYAGSNVTFREVDIQFINKFKDYLNTVKKSDEKPLSTNSKASYYCKLSAALKQAVKDKIIYGNPAVDAANYKTEDSKREFLTVEEIQKLIQTECRYEVLKRAFLFSCMTGLRWGDINRLQWRDVHQTSNGCRIVFKQQKTKGQEYLDINEQAKDLMLNRGQPDDRVFKGLTYSSYMNVELTRWVMKAGITKVITFHCGRHTFAVMLLEHEVDIFTLSKLLGHSELKTTQIYAKVLDKNKQNAISKIPNFNF